MKANKKPRRRADGVLKAKIHLAFTELEVLAGAGLAGFLALTHAGIAGEESLGLEGAA